MNMKITNLKFSKKHTDMMFFHTKTITDEIITQMKLFSTRREVFYLIRFDGGTKCGISSSFQTRLYQYLKPWCQNIEEIFLIILPKSKEITQKVEASVKKTFSTEEYSSEFFRIDFDELLTYSVRTLKLVCFNHLKKDYIKINHKVDEIII